MHDSSSPGPPRVPSLLVVLAAPWLLCAAAVAPIWWLGKWHQAGYDPPDWLWGAAAFHFYLASAAGMGLGFAAMAFGAWRLLWRSAWRRSAVGWAWPVAAWLSLGGLTEVMSRVQKL